MKIAHIMIVALLLLPTGVDATVTLTVTRHADTPFRLGFLDSALTEANRLIKFNDHACVVDVPCTVSFTRGAALGVFGTTGDGLDAITTAGELDDVFAVTSHRVKVVTSVDFCGGQLNPSIIGCGRCDATGFIVEDWVDGRVYVHEYGHNVDLWNCAHRDDCISNIMNTFWTGLNNAINQTECEGLEVGGRAYVDLGGGVYDGNGAPLTQNGGPYWIDGDVLVPSGETLTIESNVDIQVDSGRKVVSVGTTMVDGSVSPTYIYSNTTPERPATIRVLRRIRMKDGAVLLMR